MTRTKGKISGYSYLMLAEAKLCQFNKHQIQGVMTARNLHRALCFPGYRKYIWMLKNNKIPDYTVSVEDANRSLHIYGEEVSTIKGKTTKQKQSETTHMKHIEVPRSILLKHGKIHIMVDYMFV